ncbi:MAG TPA: hypothetical protein VHA14_17250 [Bryobacteraceae bacterium]|nr:hypothetical protein [Bryobacteraceae bacterium]
MNRIFPPDYDHVSVGKWLRQQAMKGFQRGDHERSSRYTESCMCRVNLPESPNSVSLALTRDMVPDYVMGWHFSISCVTETGYRGYVPEEGEYWLRIVFGGYAARAIPQPIEDRTEPGKAKDVRHWLIECNWADRSDPAVNLEGLPL